MNRFFPNYPSYKVTSPFGMRTLNGVKKQHNGIDLVARAPSGGSRTDTVTAHTAGTVCAVGYDATSGNYIRLKTAADTEMLYCHLKKKPPFSKGDRVAKGQALGYMGATGRVTGAHLHFGIRKGGKWIDPAPYLDKDLDQVEQEAVKIPLLTLARGAKGEQVRALQILLTGRGFRETMHEPDGKFGPNTERAVKAFRKAKGLGDGVADGPVWQALLGVT